MRYERIPLIKSTTTNKVVTRATLYPAIPRELNDIYVRTDSEDRLDMLAFKYYGDVNDWWIIAEANGLGKGTLRLPSGVQLRIPTNIQKIKDDFNNLNAVV